MSKKKLIAIIAIIVLLFAAGISVGVFLYGRAETQATDGNQTTEETQTDTNPTPDLQNPDEEDTTTPGEYVDGAGDNEIVENDNENANNQTANNNNVTDNTSNENVTTDTNVDNVGETTISRVEEQERLISEDFLDWWQPMTVSVKPTNVGVEIPKMDVKKTAITGYGGDYLVERNHDITYVIAVTNNEDEAVENIEITDRIPEKTTYVKDTISEAYVLKEVDGNVKSENVETKKSTIEVDGTVIGVKWVVTIPANETVFVSFKVNVNEETKATETIYNKAIANGKESNEVETSLIGIDVIKTATAVKKAGEEEFTPLVEAVREGDVIEYTIVVTNTGSRDLTNVLLEEKLIDVEITELKVDNGTKSIEFEEESGKLIIGDLKAEKQATAESEAVEAGVAVITATYEVTYEVDIKNKGNEDGTTKPIYNEAYATGESVPNPKNPDEEPEEVEDNDDEIVPVAEDPRFEITKTATRVNRDGTDKDKFIAPIGKVRPGDVVEYEIVVTNTGNTTLTNIVVTDTLSVRVDSYDGELKEVDEEKRVSTLKTIESIASGKSETIKTYYTVKITDVTTEETLIPNVATAKPNECEEKTDDELVPVNPNVSIEGTKTWYAPDGYDVPDIIIKLYQNGVPFKNKVEKEDGTIGEIHVSMTVSTTSVDEIPTYKFTGLPKYKVVDGIYELDKNGNYVENKYTVEEDDVKGFDSVKNPSNEYNFINIIEQEYISVTGAKIWDDNNNQDGIRPSSIKVNLLANEEEVASQTVIPAGENGKWLNTETYTFDSLPKYDENGKVITYKVEEELDEETAKYYEAGYQNPTSTTDEKGKTTITINITNKHIPEKIKVQVTKTWKDNNDQDGKRKNNIVVQLYKTIGEGESITIGDKVTLSSGNDNIWQNEELKYIWPGEFDRYENGKEIKYTVEEDSVANYTTIYSEPTVATDKNGKKIITLNIINTHEPEKITVKGTKTWVESGKTPKRPASITVNLLADKNKVDSAIVKPNKDGIWSYEFTNLSKYKNGSVISYTVEEESVTDYVAEYPTPITATNGDVTANITNTYRQDITGKIISIKEKSVPLDVVFVLDISSSMLEVDGTNKKSKAQDMVEAANTAITDLMENPNNRISIVLFNSDVHELTNKGVLQHYNLSNGKTKYIEYIPVSGDPKVGGKIKFVNGATIDVTTSAYDGGKQCGTYTQGGVKKAAQIFKNSADSSVARKPVMILLTDGDPTHYDTNTTYNKYGTKHPTADRLGGIPMTRFITADYYAYTMKTIENCKTAITEFYNRACEIYTVGINMKGSMAKVLLNPTKENIDKLEKAKNGISDEIYNGDPHNGVTHDWNGNEEQNLSNLCGDGEKKVKLLDDDYYRYQSNNLYTMLTGNKVTDTYIDIDNKSQKITISGSTANKISSNYAKKSYTEKTADNISKDFEEIVDIIEVKTTKNITADLYGTDRRIKLEGFNPKNIYNIIIDGVEVNNPSQYIEENKDDGYYYLNLSSKTGLVNVKMIYYK